MLKVMIVDDDFLVRQGMRDAIPWADHGCVVAALACDGQEALDLIPQALPDLIVCDVVMPRMNGLALLAHVQANWPWIKVVMVSAHDESPYIREALRSDAVEYLLKPFHEEDIARIIQKVRRKLEGERITLSAQAKANPPALLELHEHAERVQRALREMDREAALLEVRALFYALRANGVESRLLVTTACVEMVMGALRVLREQDEAPALEPWLERLNQLTRQTGLEVLEQAAVALISDVADCLSAGNRLAGRLTGQVIRLIETQYAENLTIPDLAAACNVSPNHLQTLFKREQGHTIRRHIIGVRMEKAKELLRCTTEKVYAVSARVGYQDTDFFTRTFVKYTGMTPQQYREKTTCGP